MKYFPSAKPHIGKAEEQAVVEVLRSGVLSLGKKLEEFERAFARYVGTKYAVAVSSGTAGLHLSLIAAGIKKGDEVITSPFSFVASANAILYVGATPVFADVQGSSFNLSPQEVERKITKKTKAILVVHIFGQSADMAPIMRLARKHKLVVIEDACESIGARYNGKMTGTFGQSGVFAFYPNKQMTTGEGGMIVTNSEAVYRLTKSLRNQGRGESRHWLNHERLGYNYRLSELSAALGLVQLGRLPYFLSERRKIAPWYSELLKPHDALLERPETLPGNLHSYFVYVVRIKNPKINRDRVIQDLEKEGVSAKPYLPSIHLFPFYRKMGFRNGDFPISEKMSESTVALPFYVGLTKRDVAEIVKRVVKVMYAHEKKHTHRKV